MTTPVAVSFRTFFGDYLNGVWITWKSTPSADTGTSDLEISFQCNLRSRLHIFGFGSSYADAAAVTTATLYAPGWAGYPVPYWDNPALYGANTINTDYKHSTPAT